jgi:hypothetical protein
MRSLLSICLAGVAGASAVACSGEVGLVLALDAPNGPGSASRIEIVLASPADGATATVGDQRVAPGQLDAETVRYYRQKAPAGTVLHVGRVGGFVIRVEPRDGADADEPFVPFVLAYDEDDSGLIGVGAILGEDGLPAAIDVPAGARLEATATMIPLMRTSLERGIGRGEGTEVACVGDSAPRRSGIVWRPPTGLEVRLLLPDAGQSSAAMRPLDLDCDGHAADAGDCDDLRAKYHAGAADTCDGEDTNCRGDKYALEACTVSNACPAAGDVGVRFCADVPGTTATCVPSPACRCAAGTCTKCMLAFEGAPPMKACSPGVGKLKLPACGLPGPCAIDVVTNNPRWEIAVGATSAGPFGRRVVLDGEEVFVLAKYVSPPSPLPPPGVSLGEAHLAVTSGAGTEYLGIDLELGVSANTCADQASDGATFKMLCQL